MKLLFCMTVIALSVLAQPINLPDPQAKPPEAVLKLLQWPASEVLSGKLIPATSNNVAAALQQAERWVRLVIDPQWLPGQLDPLCIAGEFDGRDVVRYRWTSGNRSFMVAQTASIFTVEVRPEAGALGGESKDQQLEAVRKVCRAVFRNTGIRRTGQGDEIETPEFNLKLMAFSFSAETTREITNGTSILAGRPKTMEEEGVKRPEKAADDEAESENWVKSGWEKTALAWMFWFRNVYWFSDRDRVVVFFLKAEAGSVPLSFGGSFDSTWFLK